MEHEDVGVQTIFHQFTVLFFLLSICCNVFAAENQRIVATIGEQPITMDEFRARKPALSSFIGQGLTEDALRDEVEHMVFSRLLAREAITLGLDQQPRVRADIEDRLSLALLRYRIPKNKLNVSPEAIRAHYEANKEKYARPRRFHAAHILLGSESRAKDILVELENGAAFDALARRYSQDPASALRGGSLGWLDTRQLAGDLAASALRLEPGQTSGVIESGFGYHIIKLIEIAPMQYRSFKSVRQEIHAELSAARQQTLVNEVKGQLWEKYAAHIQEETLSWVIDEENRKSADPSRQITRIRPSSTKPKFELLSSAPYRIDRVPAESTLFQAMLRNAGDAELTISDLSSNCACLRVGARPDTLAPGEIGALLLRLDPKKLTEQAGKGLSVVFNTNDPSVRRYLMRIEFSDRQDNAHDVQAN